MHSNVLHMRIYNNFIPNFALKKEIKGGNVASVREVLNLNFYGTALIIYTYAQMHV